MNDKHDRDGQNDESGRWQPRREPAPEAWDGPTVEQQRAVRQAFALIGRLATHGFTGQQ